MTSKLVTVRRALRHKATDKNREASRVRKQKRTAEERILKAKRHSEARRKRGAAPKLPGLLVNIKLPLLFIFSSEFDCLR
jgi:hypothetical protein